MRRPAPGRSRDRRRRWTLAIAYTALLASCDTPFAPEIEEVTRLDVTPPVLQLVVGANATITARVYGAGDVILPAAKVFWSSQNPGVVTVNQSGVATAVAPGTAQIAASAGGQSRTIAVTVTQPPIALVRITPPAGNVAVGATLALQGEALDGTGTVLPNRVLDWTSSAPQIATVNASGVVTGVAVGQATISATGEGRSGTALITVLPSPIASLTIAPNGATLPAGGTLLLVATPRDASGQPLTGRTLEWRSSNDAVATVSASGLLTAISPGTVTITVSAPGGGPDGTTPTASVAVTVLIEPVASAAIAPATATVQIGQTATLTLNLFDGSGEPLSAAGRTIAWRSSNAAVASVDNSGQITGVAVGTATITASVTTPAQPGVVEASAQVTVSSQPVASVVVSPTPATVHVGYSRQFTAVARNAAGQPLPGRVIVWTSSNQTIASVDQAGLVTGLSPGSAQIRATAEGVQGFAAVTIDLVAVSSVSVTPAAATIMPGQTVQLTATPRDSASTPITGPALGGRATIWTSLNTAVATVSTAGLVTAVAQGSANVRATIGGTNGQSAITVNPLPSASQLAVTTHPSATAQNDVAFPVQPVVQLKDASGNNVSTAGVVIQAAITAPGTGTLGGTVTATTNATGAATFSGLKITGTTGTRTLTFSSGALTPATSTAINVQPGVATQLVITVQPPASASSGQAFSTATVVQLRDVSGNDVPQSGVAVTAAPNPSVGVTLSGGTTTTSASGTATFTALRLTGTSGSYTLTFTSGSLLPATSTGITLGSGSASSLSIVQQPASSAQNGVAFSTQPVIQLVDGSGNPVAQAGVSVTAAIESGGGSLDGTVSRTTDGAGRATFTDLAITGAVGSRTLIFFASGYTTISSNPITVGPGAATALAVTTEPSSSAQSGAAFSVPPVIQLVDQSGNAVSQAGVAVTASVNGAGASLIGNPTVNTSASGTASFTGLGLSGTIGSYSLSFAASGLAGATSQPIDLAAGAAAQLDITMQPGGATSGSSFTLQPAVQLRDAGGNPVAQAGVQVTAAIASGPGAVFVGSNTATTDASGLATFSGLGLSGTVGTYTLSFSSGSLTIATSASFALGPGAPAQLSIQTQPAGAVNGAAFTTQPAVLVQDAQGNAVGTGVTVSASVNEAGATLTGSPSAQTDASGVATFSGLGLTGTAGNYTLDFATAGAPNVTSGSITLTAGGASQLTMTTQPSASVASGSQLATAPAVQLRDAAGNAVSQGGITVSVAIAPAGASLTGSTDATTDAAGVATFTGLGVTGTAADYTLQFSSAGLTGTTSSTVTVTPGPATQVTITVQPPASATSGTAFSTAPVVQLRDASGNAVSQSGIDVTASVTGGGASIVGTATQPTDAAGVATFSGLGISGGGTWTLDFASSGLTSATSSAVAVTAATTQLGMVTQPSSSAQNGQTFATQPSVRLLDAGGTPVSQSGVTVAAEITGGGATLNGTATVNTDASGVATFTDLGITGTVGSYTLTFKSTGLTDVISDAIDLTAGAAAKLHIAVQPPSTTSSGTPFSVQVRLRDAQDNDVAGAGTMVTATLNGGQGSLGGTTAVATDAAGIADFTNLSISSAGSYTITFSAPALPSATTDNIDVLPFALDASMSVTHVTRPRFAERNGRDSSPLFSPDGTSTVAAYTVGVATLERVLLLGRTGL